MSGAPASMRAANQGGRDVIGRRGVSGTFQAAARAVKDLPETDGITAGLDRTECHGRRRASIHRSPYRDQQGAAFDRGVVAEAGHAGHRRTLQRMAQRLGHARLQNGDGAIVGVAARAAIAVTGVERDVRDRRAGLGGMMRRHR